MVYNSIISKQSLVEQCPSDDTDTEINLGCLLYKVNTIWSHKNWNSNMSGDLLMTFFYWLQVSEILLRIVSCCNRMKLKWDLVWLG